MMMKGAVHNAKNAWTMPLKKQQIADSAAAKEQEQQAKVEESSGSGGGSSGAESSRSSRNSKSSGDTAEDVAQKQGVSALRPVAVQGSLVQRLMAARRSSGAAWKDFVERGQHATLILLCIFYLRLCILEFKSFRCAILPDPMESTSILAEETRSLYLVEDGQTLCWRTDHLWVLAFVALLMFVYSAGFPIYCFVLLTRAFADEHTKGCTGFLYKRFALLRAAAEEVAALKHVAKLTSAFAGAGAKRTYQWVQEDGKVIKGLSHADLAALELQRHREASYGL